MTTRRPVPSDIEAEHISELVKDCGAIPAAAFAPSRAVRRAMATLPRQRGELRIPDATVSLVDSAEAQLVGYTH